MSDEYIILLSAIFATITLISLRAIIYIIKTWQYSKIAKNSKARMEELEKLEKEGIIKTVVIDLQNEKLIGKAKVVNGVTTNEEAFSFLENLSPNKSNAFLLSKRRTGIRK